jgi:endonuclease/exonuclease/phosphatase family metal-dependent hydrolase
MKLRILTWNISYAYGIGSEGTSEYVQRGQSHFEDSLNGMSDFIRNLDIDIALLQEVDFDSRRSHHIHQLDWISRKSGLLYRNEIVSWNHPYVPYPGLNPKKQFGRVLSGGGIISKYPLCTIQNDLLPKPRENSRLYNFFYLSRYLQMASVELPVHTLKLCNLHLEAFSEDNRELHLIKLQDRLKDYELDLVGGDFNGRFDLLPQMKDTYTAHLAPEPTFPSLHPDQTLDAFISKNGSFTEIKVQTLNTGTLSDHFPVLIEVSL